MLQTAHNSPHRMSRRRKRRPRDAHLKDLEREDLRRARQRRLERIRKKFDLSFHPSLNKRHIGKATLQKFVILDSKLGGSIEKVFLMENFDGDSGYVIVLNDRTPLTTVLFSGGPQGIAKCYMNFEVIGGSPECPSESCAKAISDMMRSGDGPSLMEHMGLDERMAVTALKREGSSEWSPHLSPGDFFSVAHAAEPPHHFRMFGGVTAAKSSSEFFGMVKALSQTDPDMTFVEFFLKYPTWTIHMKNAKRNAMRAAYEMCRFLKVRTELRRDERAFLSHGEINQTKPVMAVPDFYHYDNVLIPYSGFDAEDYTRHVVDMHMSRGTVPAFNMHGDHNKRCLVYYCGASPMHFNQKTEWRGFSVVDDGEQYVQMDVPIVPDVCRFIAVPTTYPQEVQEAVEDEPVAVEGVADEVVEDEDEDEDTRPVYKSPQKAPVDVVVYPEPTVETIEARMGVSRRGVLTTKSYTPREVAANRLVLGNASGVKVNVYHGDFMLTV